MFGFSIFLNEGLTRDTTQYIKEMAEYGFSGIFTSLHIRKMMHRNTVSA